jgi:hypothetical protein
MVPSQKTGPASCQRPHDWDTDNAEGAALGLSIREICYWTEGDRFSGDPMKRTIPVFATLVALGGAAAHANVTASSVRFYKPGAEPTYTDRSAALGALSSDAGDGSVLNPFNAEFSTTAIVGLSGSSGDLILQLSGPIDIAPGAALGVHTACGLNSNFPTAVNFDPAENYTNPRTATLSVSKDGIAWTTIAANHLFTNPSNFYDQGVTDPYFQTTPGTDAAHQFQPFWGDLASFNSKDWPGTLAVLNGSAGGDWFDLSSLPISQVNYVQFATTGNELMYVDAVMGVPEPTTVPLLAAGLLLLRRRK